MDKSNLVFLDTETTGCGPTDRLCQVAYKFGGKEVESLFQPPVPIEVEAMSISHITNKMVADKEVFLGSAMHRELTDIFSNGHILVAHNAAFDREMLRRENIEIGNVIDTFKIAQHLDEEGQVAKYNLQYLRYYFDLDVENAPAHNALGDIRVLEKLFNHYFQELIAKIPTEEAVLDQMIDISARPILIKKFNFGKYSGQKIADVARENPGYLRWLLDEKMKNQSQAEENDENWIYTLEHYL